MKKKEYTGVFKSAEGHTYELTVSCNGFIQAFFLLTSEGIRSGRHYQLDTITSDEYLQTVKVDDICKISGLLTQVN